MTAQGDKPEPSGCLRALFAFEAFGWLAWCLVAAALLFTNIFGPAGSAPRWFTAGAEGVALAVALLLAGLAIHGAIIGGGLFTRKMKDGGVPLAIGLWFVRSLILGFVVAVLVISGLGITR